MTVFSGHRNVMSAELFEIATGLFTLQPHFSIRICAATEFVTWMSSGALGDADAEAEGIGADAVALGAGALAGADALATGSGVRWMGSSFGLPHATAIGTMQATRSDDRVRTARMLGEPRSDRNSGRT